jgi:transcriptional regulator with XRE-family HTH domain
MTNSTSFGFGLRLKAAREAAGLTGTELGRGAGERGNDASKASVSDWEKERHYPKADQLRVICLKLNISADHLVFGDIKNELQMIQAEASIEMLSPDQRRALLAKMLGDAAPDALVEKKMPITAKPPTPSHKTAKTKEIDRENPQPIPETPIDTFDNESKYKTRAWVIKEKDGQGGQRDSAAPAQSERRRSKGHQ